MGKFDIDRPIAELFSVEPYALRIRNVCNSHDIATIRELCLHSNWDLIHFRHLGERSIAHMEEMLGNFGLRLGMTEKELDVYMGLESDEDKAVAAIMRFEESEAVKWDQRRYEVARDLYVRYRGLSPYEAMEEAEKLILALQGVPEKNNRSKRRGNIFPPTTNQQTVEQNEHEATVTCLCSSAACLHAACPRPVLQREL